MCGVSVFWRLALDWVGPYEGCRCERLQLSLCSAWRALQNQACPPSSLLPWAAMLSRRTDAHTRFHFIGHVYERGRDEFHTGYVVLGRSSHRWTCFVERFVTSFDSRSQDSPVAAHIAKLPFLQGRNKEVLAAGGGSIDVQELDWARNLHIQLSCYEPATAATSDRG